MFASYRNPQRTAANRVGVRPRLTEVQRLAILVLLAATLSITAAPGLTGAAWGAVAHPLPTGRTHPATPGPVSPAGGNHPVVVPGAPALGTTFVVGDSTSARLTGARGKNLWKARHPTWNVDAQNGRLASALDDRINAYLSHVDSAPDTLVMALGTNPDTAHWSKRDYKRSLSMLPPGTNVVLVIPLRAGSRTPAVPAVDDTAAWLRAITRTRPRTAAANWRHHAQHDAHIDPYTGASALLVDGVHQTNPRGRELWMRLLGRSWRSLPRS